MAGRVHNTNHRISQSNFISVTEQCFRRPVSVILPEEQGRRIFDRITQHIRVRLMNGEGDTVFFPYNIRTENMVKMAVCQKDLPDCQSVLPEHVIDSLRYGRWVDQHRQTGFIIPAKKTIRGRIGSGNTYDFHTVHRLEAQILRNSIYNRSIIPHYFPFVHRKSADFPSFSIKKRNNL